jgi:hypothetical protein
MRLSFQVRLCEHSRLATMLFTLVCRTPRQFYGYRIWGYMAVKDSYGTGYLLRLSKSHPHIMDFAFNGS